MDSFLLQFSGGEYERDDIVAGEQSPVQSRKIAVKIYYAEENALTIELFLNEIEMEVQ